MIYSKEYFTTQKSLVQKKEVQRRLDNAKLFTMI